MQVSMLLATVIGYYGNSAVCSHDVFTSATCHMHFICSGSLVCQIVCWEYAWLHVMLYFLVACLEFWRSCNALYSR